MEITILSTLFLLAIVAVVIIALIALAAVVIGLFTLARRAADRPRPTARQHPEDPPA